MKHVKSFGLFEKTTSADYNEKIRDLKDKIDGLDDKGDDLNTKRRDEEDPQKQELHNLNLQKVQLQEEIAKIDLAINKIKRAML
jgi:predicted  nucleic acid-binding Zn-ribbon protein